MLFLRGSGKFDYGGGMCLMRFMRGNKTKILVLIFIHYYFSV